MEKKALGKGLESLLPGRDMEGVGPSQTVQMISITKILSNRDQPRKSFPSEELEALAASIKENGILQPILVRRTGDGVYELIAGERRYRAAKLANLSTVPALIRHSKDDESTVLALVENIQRQDLNPMEEARAYTRLINEFGITQEMVAQKIGRDRSSVANFCRLVTLPNEIQAMIESDRLTLGHAKVILSLHSSQIQVALAKRIFRDHLSVRQTEKLVKNLDINKEEGGRKKSGTPQNTNTEVEEQLRKHLGTKIRIRPKKRGGEVILTYYSHEDLTRIVDVILS